MFTLNIIHDNEHRSVVYFKMMNKGDSDVLLAVKLTCRIYLMESASLGSVIGIADVPSMLNMARDLLVTDAV